MSTHVTTDTPTQAIVRVPTAVVAVREPEVAAPAPDPEVEAGAEPEAEVARTETVQEMYEAGLAKLDALHDRWAAAMAEIRETPANDDPEEAAA